MSERVFSLTDLLRKTVEMGGSDLHITSGSPPRLRLHGELLSLDFPSLVPEETQRLVYSVMTDKQKHRFEEDLEIDFSFGIKDLCRFRANIFTQRGGCAGVFRIIPFKILSIQDLHLPPIIETLTEKPRGLVLITGPTGSGKSTTLAAMIDKINTERNSHIVTVEDPIEFLHRHKSCLINQREVGGDTKGFAQALRVVLREDPDVVLIGEMRDLETIEAALRIAETGHLTFATLHTNSTYATINRVVDSFPPHQQQQIRAQLSLVLEGVVCQSLLPRADGMGRVVATEVMIPTPGIRNLIRENKVHQIYSMMQTGQEKYGMHTLNQSLARLYMERKITYDVCLSQSSNIEELQKMLDRSGVGEPVRAH